MRNLNWWVFAETVSLAAALGAISGYISGWAKFAKVAKYGKLPGNLVKLKKPIIRNLVVWSTKGTTFVIKSIVGSFTRKPGESWDKAIRRKLGI